MRLYARPSPLMILQVVGDVLALAAILGLWLISGVVQTMIAALAQPSIEAAGTASATAERFRQTADQLGRVPVIGGELGTAFDAGAESLRSVAAAADSVTGQVRHAADLAALLIFVVPLAMLLVLWLPPRIRFAVRSQSIARALKDDVDLEVFALKGMLAASPRELLAISAHPLTDLQNGDRQVIARLAALELRRWGIRLPRSRLVAQ